LAWTVSSTLPPPLSLPVIRSDSLRTNSRSSLPSRMAFSTFSMPTEP